MPEELEAYQLMMDALDGEISANGRKRLQHYIDSDPGIAEEWAALSEIDDLFRSTPALQPAADFAQRTIARLPNTALRRRVIRIIYATLFLSGILPVVLLLWGFSRLSSNNSDIIYTIFNAIGNGVQTLMAGLGTRLVQEPLALFTIFLMVASLFIWRTVYLRLKNQKSLFSLNG